MRTAVRKTVSKPATLEGCGLHSGQKVRLQIGPAAAGSGLTFRRTDLPDATELTLADTFHDGPPFRSALKRGAAEVHTVEHVLSALSGLQVTDALISIDGAEMPGMDGSAQPFVEALKAAGVADLPGPAVEPIVIKQALTVSEGAAQVAALPYDGFKVSYTLNYPNEPLAQGHLDIDFGAETFEREIAPARTFCMKKEAEALRAAGFGKGASTANTLVIEGRSVLENTLRFPDEPVRHKILDLVGDLYLAGRPVRGHIVGCRSGHKLNRALARLLVQAVPAPAKESGMLLDINQIKQVLPHRYPFLLVDRILEIEEGKRIVGLKNVTANENFFQGHFPGEPIMPGVLILEALAQVGAVMVLKGFKAEGQVALFTGMDDVAFRRKVVPGDQIRLEAEVDRVRPPFGRYKTRATVEGELAAEAVLKFMVPAAAPKKG